MLAVSPLIALLNKHCAILAVALASPRVSSSPRCLRNVFSSQPISTAICRCGKPIPDSTSAWFRSSALNWRGGRPPRCSTSSSMLLTLGKATALALQRGLLPCERLPPAHRHVHVGRAQLDGVARAAGHLGGDD